MADSDPQYTLQELCVLVDIPVRTLRFYVQGGLVDRPVGETRAARYGARHLEQLLLIKKWTAAGVSLDRIREILRGAPPAIPERPRTAGSVEVRSHIHVADGLEVVVEPGRAGLSAEQVRALARGIANLYAQVMDSARPESSED